MVYGVTIFLVALNIWTALIFWHDKRRAISGGRRVPEANLLGLALLGGTPGAFLARRWFRHKTRKEPFSTQLLFIAAIHIGLIAGLVL
jgi:uncharacterized membrane protein YsdA (DUF1294 family)